MSCITEIANELFIELSEPSDVSIPAIAFWLRSNFGKLNIVTCKNFEILPPDYNITPEINETIKDIFKTLYVIYYLGRQVEKNLGAASVNTVVEIDSDGSKVKKTSKNDNAKVWLEIKKNAQEDLKNLLNAYRFCVASNSIASIAGSDGLYTSYSCVWKSKFRCRC